MCLEHIREAMLHHRWQEAAEYMACYPQILEASTCVSARKDKEVGCIRSFLEVFVPSRYKNTVVVLHRFEFHTICTLHQR